MFKKILVVLTLLYATASFAAVDVNTASAAELDGVKGIGPGLSTRILDERKSGNFKDWNDFIARVSGVGEKSATRFSSEGLTVNGKKFTAGSTAKADAKAQKDAAAPSAQTSAKKKDTAGSGSAPSARSAASASKS
jgi:competence protein ComEA